MYSICIYIFTKLIQKLLSLIVCALVIICLHATAGWEPYENYTCTYYFSGSIWGNVITSSTIILIKLHSEIKIQVWFGYISL